MNFKNRSEIEHPNLKRALSPITIMHLRAHRKSVLENVTLLVLRLEWIASTRAISMLRKYNKNISRNWINSLRPSDAYIRQWSNHHWLRQWLVAWSAPSHYQNQCWNIVNKTLRNKLQWNFNRNSNIFIQENVFESVVCGKAAILSRPQCVKRDED